MTIFVDSHCHRDFNRPLQACDSKAGYRHPWVAKISASLFLASLCLAAKGQAIDLVVLPNIGLGVHAVINGQSGDFLFDTGEGLSALTPEFAGRIGCRPWGEVTGFRMSGEAVKAPVCNGASITIGAVAAQVDTVQVVDINKFLPAGTPKVDGALGLDLFDAKVVSFSQRKRRLLVADAVPESLMDCQSVPIHVVRDAEGLALSVNLPVRTSAGLAWLEMDSGNTSPYTLLNRAIANATALDASLAAPQRTSLVLGDGQALQTDALVRDLILDGNLGSSFLAAYDVTVDLTHRRAWLVASDGRKCPART